MSTSDARDAAGNDQPVFAATPGQTVFIDDRASETAYVGGVGSGKTAAGVIRARRHVTEWNPGQMGVIVSPTVPMLRNAIIPELRKWGLLGGPGVDFNRSEKRIEYPNDSVIVLESANNKRKIDRLRAMNLAWAWMDEAAYQSREAFNVLSDRLRVGNYRNLFATTTPRGFNWVHDVFAAPMPDDPDVTLPADKGGGEVRRNESTTAVLGVSTRGNPQNPADYIERQERRRSGEAYRQEIEGEFVSFEGLVYKWFDDENRVTRAALPDTYDKTIYGIDWGGSAPTAILALRQAGDDWYLVDEFYQRRVVNETIIAELSRMHDTHGPGPVYCDTNEPRAIEQLSREGYDAREADKAVETGIRYVDSLRDRLHIADDCQNVINEFNAYQYKNAGESDDVLKENDHAMDALRYALFTDHERGQTTGVSYAGDMTDLF